MTSGTSDGSFGNARRHESLLVTGSVRAYGFLLLSFPKSFRRRFVGQLTAVFSDAAHEAFRERRLRGLVILWLRSLGDLGVSSFRERLQPRRNEITCPQDSAPRGRKRRLLIMDTILHDLRHSFRMLLQTPGLSLAVIATLALGIAGAASIYTVVDGILMRPLPFPDSERVVIFCETHPSHHYCVASPPNTEDWGRAAATIEDVGVARHWPWILRDGPEARSLRGAVATAGMLRILGAKTALGRLLEDEDMQPGRNQVVVLSHAYWMGNYAGSSEVLGRTMDLDGRPFEIIGVLAERASAGSDFEDSQIWTPLSSIQDDWDQRDWRGFTALGRLSGGYSLDQARSEMAGIHDALAERYPESNADWGLRVERLREWMTAPVRTSLMAFLGAVGFLLLLVSANVANLLLARSSSRSGEFAIRLWLGAGRLRLMRQVLTESLGLALVGGIVGAVLALWGVQFFLSLAPGDIPRLSEITPGVRTIFSSFAICLAMAVLFGALPAWFASRTRPGQLQRSTGSRTIPGGRMRGWIVAAELGLMCILLNGAGLMMRGYSNLLDWDPGFDPNNLTTSFTLASFDKYNNHEQVALLHERMGEEIRSLPGVESAALASAGPLFGGIEGGEFAIEGRPQTDPSNKPTARWYDIDPYYFRTLRIPILRGRDIRDDDRLGTPPAALINNTFAKRFWPSRDAIGQRVTIRDNTWEIVGIVADVTPFDPRTSAMPEIYWPTAQAPRWGAMLVIRSSLDAVDLERQTRDRLRKVDPDLQISSFETMASTIKRQLVSPRFQVALTGLFALVAIVLGGIGVSGVIGCIAVSRRHEIGVRMALGALPRRIQASMVARAAGPAIAGLAAGLIGTQILARFLSSLFLGIPAHDPWTMASVVAVFGLVALAASYIPARRASKLDPLTALRAE